MSAVADRVEVLGCAIDRADMERDASRAATSYVEPAATPSTWRSTRRSSSRCATTRALRRASSPAASSSPPTARRSCGRRGCWATRCPSGSPAIDLMHGARSALAERRGYRVYFLGARADVLERAIARLRERHPRLVGRRLLATATSPRPRSRGRGRDPRRAARTCCSSRCPRRARSTSWGAAAPSSASRSSMGVGGADRRRRGRDQTRAAAAAAAGARVAVPARCRSRGGCSAAIWSRTPPSWP